MSIRWQQIRSFAADVRAAYAAKLRRPVPEALPADDVAERLYVMSAFPDPTLDPRINGELNPVHRSIRLRPGLTPERERFIIAHELGHWVLEGQSTILFQDDDSTIDERVGGVATAAEAAVPSYNTRERREQEANLFALELLIPADRLWVAVQQSGWNAAVLAARYGVSDDAIRTQLINVCCLEPVVVATDQVGGAGASIPLNADQRAAIDAPLPTLVIAGPGTGKTRSIVAKYCQLVENGVDPAAILALTFSNKAAEEMRARIAVEVQRVRPELAGRVEISTFHAWGLDFLKLYGHAIGLPLDVQLRTKGDLYILLKRHLPELPLNAFKSLSEPGQHLPALIGAVSRAKDELFTPDEFRIKVEAEAERVVREAEQEQAGKKTKQAQQARDNATKKAQRLREIAAFYTCYEAILRAAHVLDFGDLVMRAVEALRLPEVAASIHQRYEAILVDEFQDINYASGELVRLIDGGRGRVWAVGDPWQSIYRFRGASPVNLDEFTHTYPRTTTAALRLNYRSAAPILDASYALMQPDPLAATREPLQPGRTPTTTRHVLEEWVVEHAVDQYALIAHDILQCIGGSRLRRHRCAHPARAGAVRRATHRRRPLRRARIGDFAVLCRTHRDARQAVAALEAHNIPVEWTGSIFDQSEVKDMLAVCACVRSSNSSGWLRLLTIPEHALTPADLQLLARLAYEHKRSLPRATRDVEITAQISPEGRATLQEVVALLEELGEERDAWRVLTHYMLEKSLGTRQRIERAGRGDQDAQRELATLGMLILAARNFTRGAPPDERGAADFVRYVRLLLEAGEAAAQAVPARPGMVRVLTVHAAKGLEFPVVYVPTLIDGVYPQREQGSMIPPLPAHGAPLDAVREERYLLYVAMTRAQQRLVLLRPKNQGKKSVKRSPLLPGGPLGKALWPVRQRTPQHCTTLGHNPVRLTRSPLSHNPATASSMDTYKRCPRRFLYQYGFLLYDDQSPNLRMHQTIRDGVNELVQRAREQTLPADPQALNDLLWGLFARHEMVDVLYARDYFDVAFGHVQRIWDALRLGEIDPGDVNQTFMVERPAGAVQVRVDRVEHGAAGTRWLQVRTGRPSDGDHLKTRIILYALAYEAAYASAANLAIRYTATGQEEPVVHRPATLKDHTGDVDAMLRGINAGHWEVKPSADCATCPFNLICPV